eukprot:scaffold224186_cov61-Attheya_sp.AAC.1
MHRVDKVDSRVVKYWRLHVLDGDLAIGVLIRGDNETVPSVSKERSNFHSLSDSTMIASPKPKPAAGVESPPNFPTVYHIIHHRQWHAIHLSDQTPQKPPPYNRPNPE